MTVREGFDASSVAADLEFQNTNIMIVIQKIKMLEDRVGNDINFAKTLQSSALSATGVENTIVGLLVKALESNDKVKSHLSKAVDAVDRGYFKRLAKNLWLSAWSVIVALITVASTALISKLL